MATKQPARLLDQESESEDSGPKNNRYVSKIEFDEAMDSFDESIKQMQATITERYEQLAQKITQQQLHSQENNARILQQQEEMLSKQQQEMLLQSQENNARILQQQEEVLSKQQQKM
ncbi:MAG: hypothetical protein ACK56F_15135, partial [bacterium]